ncbi:MAG: hypothetical protein JO048_11340 [Methylobacteriaceae bacterium]|nr:hypothetical protein [Methylobacteriaceae bacterium]
MLRAFLLAAALAASATAAPAASCSENRDRCEAICTPERVARYYFGGAHRCTASCGPRFQQCLRTGIWVHLEDSQAGFHEPVDGF